MLHMPPRCWIRWIPLRRPMAAGSFRLDRSAAFSCTAVCFSMSTSSADFMRRTIRSYRFPEVALAARWTECSLWGSLGVGLGRVAGQAGGPPRGPHPPAGEGNLAMSSGRPQPEARPGVGGRSHRRRPPPPHPRLSRASPSYHDPLPSQQRL